MGQYLNIQEIFVAYLKLGYGVKLMDFGGSLEITLFKRTVNYELQEFSIKQIVPYYYLNNNHKTEKLLDFMHGKLNEIIKARKNNENK